MKTKLLMIALAIAIVAPSTLVAASDKDKTQIKGPDGRAKAPALEKIEFIHYKKDSGKAKPGSVCGNGTCEPGENARKCPEDCAGGGEEPPDATCYAFMGQYGKNYLKWRNLPIQYEINPTNGPIDMTGIDLGAYAWDQVTGASLFNLTSPNSEATYNVQDYVNAVCFDDYYDDPDIIAACMVWYNPATKAIVEFDIVFETDFNWGDAGDTDEDELGDTEIMDVWNIATHELGHALGLADIYDNQCSDVTMFWRSTEGETKKRTLDLSDITGVQTLYGE